MTEVNVMQYFSINKYCRSNWIFFVDISGSSDRSVQEIWKNIDM